MKNTLLFLVLTGSLLFPSSSFGCSSDCRECHTIPEDQAHKVLSRCTECHKQHSDKALEGRCGADCFDCHDYQKTLRSSSFHSVLLKCIECHKKLKEKSQALPLQNFLEGKIQ